MSSKIASDGGTIDLSREIENNVLNNLFNDISHALSISGTTDYRKFFIKNENLTYSWMSIKFWIYNQLQGDSEISVGIGTVDDEDGSVITYYQVNDEQNGLNIGNLSAGESQGIWIKRIIQQNAKAQQDDYCVLMFSGGIN